MNMVVIQLTPVELSANSACIAGVETPKTVSFKTAKKMRKRIHGRVFLTSRVSMGVLY
jgi:hypothetical protein